MQTKQFTGASIDEVLRQIRADLGEEAVILETRRVVKGGLGGFFGREMIEVTAADGLEGEATPSGGRNPEDAAADLPTANRVAAASMLNLVDEDDPRVPFARQLRGRLAAATEAEDHPAMRPATAAGPVVTPRPAAAAPAPAPAAPAVEPAWESPVPVDGPAASPASAYARAAAPVATSAAPPVPTSTPERPFARGDVDRTRAIIEAARAAMRTAEEGRAAAAPAAPAPAPAAAVPPPAFIPARRAEPAPAAPVVTAPAWERISTSAPTPVPGSAAALAPPPAALVDRRAPVAAPPRPALAPSPVTPAPQPIIPAPAPVPVVHAPAPIAVTPPPVVVPEHVAPVVRAPVAEAAATLAPAVAEPDLEPDALAPVVDVDDADDTAAGGRCAAALRAVRADLVAAGVDPRYLDPFLEGVTRNALPFLPEGADVREAVRAAIATRIPVSREWKNRPRHQALAFVGQHGVGKTSIVRKLAWRLHQADLRVAVVCAGPEADMSLESLASRLGLAFAHAEDGDALAAVRQELSECDIVLIDTPGRSHTNLEDMEELGKLLSAARIEEVHLVLPVSLALADLGDVSRRFRIAGVNRLTLTKLDETRLLGNLVNIPLRMAKPLSFLADGVSTTGDLSPADPRRVASLLLP